MTCAATVEVESTSPTWAPRVSVGIASWNNAARIAPALKRLVDFAEASPGIVDEVVVLDRGKSTGTEVIVNNTRVRALSVDEVMPECGPAVGKGDLLWRYVASTTAEIVVWCDTDLDDFRPEIVDELIRPLLSDPTLMMTRAIYKAPSIPSQRVEGEVTEAIIAPMVRDTRRGLRGIRQPLNGDYAVRRSALMAVPFEPDFGVDVGLLLDIAATCGPDAILDVETAFAGRDRSTRDLLEHSRQVTRVLLSRASSLVVRGALPLRPALNDVKSGLDLTARVRLPA